MAELVAQMDQKDLGALELGAEFSQQPLHAESTMGSLGFMLLCYCEELEVALDALSVFDTRPVHLVLKRL